MFGGILMFCFSSRISNYISTNRHPRNTPQHPAIAPAMLSRCSNPHPSSVNDTRSSQPLPPLFPSFLKRQSERARSWPRYKTHSWRETPTPQPQKGEADKKIGIPIGRKLLSERTKRNRNGHANKHTHTRARAQENDGKPLS